MERLTTWRSDNRAAIANNDGATPLQQTMKIPLVIDRLALIEDILGDNYDLNRLRELVEADRDGRCVVLPSGGYADKDGENALKSAMNTCFYHNNPVTRYIADAIAEKLTREAAEDALKGDQNGN